VEPGLAHAVDWLPTILAALGGTILSGSSGDSSSEYIAPGDATARYTHPSSTFPDPAFPLDGVNQWPLLSRPILTADTTLSPAEVAAATAAAVPLREVVLLGEWAINRGSTTDRAYGMVSGLLIEVVLWIQCMAW
jgi:hypothetical protein